MIYHYNINTAAALSIHRHFLSDADSLSVYYGAEIRSQVTNIKQ